MQVSEGSYSQTVGWMKLRAQELTTSFFHLVQLEQACRRQQRLSNTPNILRKVVALVL